ncbi:MAG: hypothetical protein LC118_15120, partial [Dehalococcoidia bacterium]|nr:hypothetical protein [Dehalococcoidia bacterium]
MRRVVKWLLVISVLGALVAVALRFIASRRTPAKKPVERWEPPAGAAPAQTVTVEPPPRLEEEPAFVAGTESIIEGEFEPPEEGGPPEDLVLEEEPAEELSEPLLDADRAEAEPELAAHLREAEPAALEGEFEPPEEGGPPEDLVLEEEPA